METAVYDGKLLLCIGSHLFQILGQDAVHCRGNPKVGLVIGKGSTGEAIEVSLGVLSAALNQAYLDIVVWLSVNLLLSLVVGWWDENKVAAVIDLVNQMKEMRSVMGESNMGVRGLYMYL